METYHFRNDETLGQFHEIIEAKMRNGFIIVERNEKLPYVVLCKEKRAINHPFHFLVTCATLGLWGFAWFYLAVTFSKKKNILVAVDEDGNLFEDKCLSK